MSWLKEVIGTEKAVIAMCHLRALPVWLIFCCTAK